ncbi:MAG: hypothetical protein WBX38_09165 [Candidatus Sulfotelmatobacter sp.]
MRILFRQAFCTGALLLLAFASAISQDTSFSSGPQYLRNTSSPDYSRPISTPTLTLSGPALEVGASNATGVLIAGASDQDVLPPAAVALPKIDLLPILYGDRKASGGEGNPLEINFPGTSSESSFAMGFPARFLNVGVSQEASPDMRGKLGNRGYGITLGQAAAREKAPRGPVRLYTNADIERLHSGN